MKNTIRKYGVALLAFALLALFTVSMVNADKQPENPQTLFIDGYVEDQISGGNEITTTLPLTAGVGIYNASPVPVHVRVYVPWSFTIMDWTGNGSLNGTTGEPLNGTWSNVGSYQVFDGWLPCRNPSSAQCAPPGVPDFVFSTFSPIEEGSTSFWIVVDEVGVTSYTSEILTVNVVSPSQFWEPYLQSVTPQEVRDGDQQHLAGEGFIPPNTGEYGPTFVAYIEQGQPITSQVTATITSLTPTSADVIVPALEPGPWKVYLGWIRLDGSGWVVGNWMDVTILPPVPPTSVALTSFEVQIAPGVNWWAVLAGVIAAGSAVTFMLNRLNNRRKR